MRIEALAVKKVRPRDVRTELGLTQRQLGALAGISHVTIVKAENMESIRLLSAQAILKALNKERVAQGLPKLHFDTLDWKVQGEGD